jgi:ABC-type polysaccharide/polyol phosphate export permease
MEDYTTEPCSEIYDSDHRDPLPLEELKGVVKYRSLIVQLVNRDIISRYKRSVLGIAWTMLNPFGTMLILALVFSRLFHSLESYPIYVLSGLIGWTFFSQTLFAALNQNVWGGAILHRIYIPRTTFTISALGTGLINFLISLIPLAVIMLVLSFPFHSTLLFLPVSILLLAMFTLGLALLFSTLAIYFPDTVDMIQVALTAWMYLTPIIYPKEIVPEVIRNWVFPLNPLYYFVELIRQPIYDGALPSAHILIISLVIAVITLVAGWLVSSWKANELTYRT